MIALLLVCALTGETQFYRAAALERAGRPAEAVAIFESIVTGPFADDALNEAARIYEEKLGDPARAADTYARLVKEHPDSRLAERARRRARALRRAMGPGNVAAPAVAEMNAILLGAARRPRAESIARMQHLLARWPSFPDAPRALFWLGTQEVEAGRRAAALGHLREIATRFPGGEWAARAHRAAGDLLLQDGDLTAAGREYRALMALDAESGTAAFARLRRARWRARGVLGSWIVLGAAALAALVAIRRAAGSLAPLRRPPAEALYLLPVAALLSAAAIGEHQSMTLAVAIICAGGLVVAWLSGAALEAVRAGGRRLSGRRVAAHAAVAVAAMLAVCYIAVMRAGLYDFLVETLRFGPER